MKPYYEHAGITIYHGDCEDILPYMRDFGFGVCLTDPPYGVGMDYGDGSDDSPERHFEWFASIRAELRRISKNVVFTHRQAALGKILDADKILIWNKPMAFGYSIKGWLAHWEPIFVYGKPDGPGLVNGASFDVFTYCTEPKNGHPCPKPTSLYRHLCNLFSGDVLDPFAGSGTTLFAAKQLGRKAIGIEIEEKYCEIAAKRLSQEVFTFEK